MADSKEKKTGFFKTVSAEFKKIIWPTGSTVLRNTAVTLLMVVLLGILVGAVDFGLGALLGLLG